MTYQEHKRAIGTFANRQQTETAMYELRNSSFPMDKVSVLAKNTDFSVPVVESEDGSGNNAEEGTIIGGTTGTILGGLGGLLVGLQALIIPGVGPFLAAGTIAATLAGAGLGAAAGGLIGTLTGLGIPDEQAKDYSERVSQGQYLVIIEGSEEEIKRAASILSNQGIREWRIHDISNGRYNSDLPPTTMGNRDTESYAGVSTKQARVETIDNPVV
ncbi:signal transduction histidine kinase LytS [Anabaena cylindrica UHCC 0172]|uniref:signal transduction histidine kinase LytS n=1 Tax=Anabaena cylindrica TaxID=1165 RepID=UPI002B1ECAED|nr:signal transduction histidine kinase LytS [Anabaena cylindrica]MEA5551155.1 signal transduction histidine kinase LytS [Anabaena cylindrica UHCC 0172]